MPDFLYTLAGTQIIVRIEGFYWHIGKGAEQQARDLYLMTHASVGGGRVHRVTDSDYMSDVTGSTAIRLLADILAGRPRVGTLQGGTVAQPRYADFIGGTAG